MSTVGDNMDKKNKQYIVISIIFACIVSLTLFYMYDNYVFQTYGDVVYYDCIFNGENNDIEAENIEVYCKNNTLLLENGSIYIKNDNLLSNIENIEASLVLQNNEDQREYKLQLVKETNNKLTIQKNIKKNNFLKDLKNAKLVIRENEKNIDSLKLEINPVEQLEGSNKEYRIENAAVSKQMMRLGNLKTTDENIIKEYPNISLEYRYLKNEKLDKDDNDNYVVFKKITGKSIELVNAEDYGNFYLDEGNLNKMDLSVVIIFSNDKEKFAFSIDLSARQVGDYYG